MKLALDPEQLNKRSQELLTRTQEIGQTLSRYAQTYHEKKTTAYRQVLIDGIERAEAELNTKREKEEGKSDELWVMMLRIPGLGVTNLIVTKIVMELPSAKSLPIEEFFYKVGELKTSVHRGEQDEHLKTNPERFIYEFLMTQPDKKQ